MVEITEVAINMPETTEVNASVSTAREFHDAAIKGNINTSSLSSNSEIPACMDPKFYKAAVEGNIDAFRGKGSEIVSILTPNKNTILHIHFTNYTVSETFVEEILCMCPALVMKANAKGETLLHIAARYGHSKLVNVLIQRDKRLIGVINNEKDTALHEAVRFHHTEVVDILIKEDPDYSYFGNSNGETPLYIATERAYSDVVLKILQNCKEPNQDGPNGRTALHAAVLNNDKELVPKLLTKSSIKQGDENGWVPLHLAALHWSPKLAEVFLKYDRDTAYMRDKRGRTALHFAACCGNVRTMEKIIEYSPDCSELVDEQGYNALHYSAASTSTYAADAARMILKNASLSNLYNEKDKNGNTPLHHTAKFFKGNYIHPLLKSHQRVDPMAFNIQNQTTMDVASSSTPEPVLLLQLRNIGAKYGGRIINKDDRKKEQDKRHDSAVDVDKIQEKREESSRMDRVKKANSLVATLIATVTFAAGFTLPGGIVQEHDQPDKGSPILKHNPSFVVFTFTNPVAFLLSTFAVLLHIFASLASKHRFVHGYFIRAALVLTLLAAVFMIIAFVAGSEAVMDTSHKIGYTMYIFLGLFLIFGFYLYHRIISMPKLWVHFLYGRPMSKAKDIQLSETQSI